MGTRTLLVSVVLVLVCGVALSQPLSKPATPPLTPPVEVVPTTIPGSVDQLLTELERVRAQKVELERKEKELKAALGKKLEEQADRLKKLGIAPLAAKDAEPDRVGRLIIEGNTKTPDKTVRNLMVLTPGDVLKYPLLEASRQNLEKYGFRDVTVEVIRNELDPRVKDIRVRVTEKDAR